MSGFKGEGEDRMQSGGISVLVCAELSGHVVCVVGVGVGGG